MTTEDTLHKAFPGRKKAFQTLSQLIKYRLFALKLNCKFLSTICV